MFSPSSFRSPFVPPPYFIHVSYVFFLFVYHVSNFLGGGPGGRIRVPDLRGSGPVADLRGGGPGGCVRVAGAELRSSGSGGRVATEVPFQFIARNLCPPMSVVVVGGRRDAGGSRRHGR